MALCQELNSDNYEKSFFYLLYNNGMLCVKLAQLIG